MAYVIKRYSNRKLYDTQESRYVTLEEIEEMIRAGKEIAVVDAASGEDLTSVTLAHAMDVGCGLGGIGLLDELAAGSAGAMTGFSFPEGLLACVNAWQAGGFEAARAAFLPFLPLVNFEQQVRIALAVRKEVLHRRGLIAESAARPPAASFPPTLSEPLDRHLAAVEAAVPALQEVG